MAFVLTEEQLMLRDMAKQFFAEQVPTTNLRKLRDEKNADGYDKAIWQKIIDLGFAGILIPEQYGGTDFGPIGMGIVMEEAGRTLAASPLFSTAILGATAILHGGSDEQKSTFLPKIAAGTLLTALGVEETPHHKPQGFVTQAQKDGDGYRLTGEKRFVLDGHIADMLIIAAKSDDASECALFLVDAKAEGVGITRTLMADSRNAALVALNNASAQCLGTPNEGAATLTHVLDIGRIAMAAEMLGGVEEVFETTLAYLKERKQFGVIIGSFQALKHRAAEMFCHVEIAQSVVLNALSALEDQRNDIPQAASLAKARLCDTAKLVSNEGVQMHGGIGMTDDVDMGLFLKRARVQAQIFGDARYHTDRFGALSGY